MNTTVKKLKVLKLIILTLVAAGILLALTACGSADSLEFKLIMDEYYVVTDVKEDYPQKIVVPSKYEGLPVREIGSSAFANCKNLKSVVLPNSIRFINIRAFYNCVLSLCRRAHSLRHTVHRNTDNHHLTNLPHLQALYSNHKPGQGVLCCHPLQKSPHNHA